jgi:predicted ATPase
LYQANYFIISGGSGSGKTSIVEKLAARGFTTVPEAGRAILREQAETGGTATHDGDAAAYGGLMLKRGIDDYRRMRGTDEPVFFDRGIAEVIGYFRLKGLPVPPDVASAAHEYRSNRLVFLTPPWQAIYRRDAERRQDWAEAVRTFELIRDAYVEAGYDPVEVPQETVARRVRFILDEVDAVADEG